MKAKAVVEQARAQYVLAKAEYQKALAAHEQANAEYRKAETAWMQAKADYAAAESAEKQAWAEKQIAQYQHDMEQAALRHQTTMVNLQNNLAVAQRNYEVVLKQIEIAEAVMSDKDKVTVEELKAEANKQFALIFGGSYMDGDKTITVVEGTPGENEVQSFKGKVKDAYDEYYTAMEDKVTEPKDDESDYFIPQLELDLELKEAALVAANEKVAKLEAFLNEDVETNDWRKAVEELEDSINILKKEKRELLVQAEEVKASQEYRDAEQAYMGITDEGEIGKVDEDDIEIINVYKQKGTAQKLTLAKDVLSDALGTADEGKKVTVDAVKVGTTNKVMQIVSGDDTDSRTAYEVAKVDGKKGQFELVSGKVQIKEGEELELNLKAFEEFVEDATEASANLNDAASSELQLEKKKEAVKKAEEFHAEKVALWEIAKRAYQGDDTDKVPTDILTAGVSAYNAEYADLEAKVTAYNNAFDAAVKSIYDEKVADAKEKNFGAEYVTVLTNKIKTSTTDPRFNQGDALIQYNGASDDEKKSILFLEYLINAYALKTTDGSGKETSKEQNAAAILAGLKVDAQNEVNAYYETTAGKEELKVYQETADKEAAGEVPGVEQPKSVKDAKTALDEAKDDIVEAYYNLGNFVAGVPTDVDAKTDAFQAYQYLARYTYGREITVDYTKVNKQTETGVSTSVAEGTYYEVDKSNKRHFKVVRTKISDESVAKFAAVKINSDYAEDAWNATSITAFGVKERALEMTESEFEKLLKDAGASLEAALKASSYGKLYEAREDLSNCEESISSADDLKKFVEDLNKALSDYKAAIESVKTATYGEEIKAYDDAVVANDKAKAAYEAEVHKYDVASLDADKLQLKIEALGEVKSELIAAIRAHLGIDLVGEDEETPGKYDVKSFTEQLQKTIDAAKQEVVNAQRDVELAKINLDKAQNGDFDEVALAKSKLDAALAQLQKAQDAYDAILANIQTALEIMAKTAE